MNSKELMLRTKEFAKGCVLFAITLPNSKIGNHLQGQLVRCSTSVAANYRATRLAQTRAGFIAKLSIVIEEADESEFWLEFIEELNLNDENVVKSLKQEAHELASIFISSRKTMMKQKN